MNYKKKIFSVTTMTPHRISFAGGGSDYPQYFNLHGGSVINSTIDKYLLVTVSRHSEIHREKYRLMYSKTELCNQISEIKNNIARECLKLVPVDAPLTISTNSDLPTDSGTGSSSSFAVGLLNALHLFRGENPSPIQLAREACNIEIDKLKKNSGKQDQYAAAYGGFNNFLFEKKNEVIIKPINMKNENIKKFFSNIVLLWTGIGRNSSKIVKDYKFKNEKTKVNLGEIKKFVKPFKYSIEKDKLKYRKVSSLIEESWELKKKISKKISNEKLEKYSLKLHKIGINGHRIIGAGGGGFFLCFANPSKQKIISKIFNKDIIMKVRHEPLGSRPISIVYN